MTPIIFLDIDGTLNGERRYPNGYCGIDPGCVSHLNRIVGATGAGIVVTSAWRYMIHNGAMTLEGFRYLLLIHGLDFEVPLVGLTARDEMIVGRGPQITDWWRHHRDVSHYVVLDNGSDEPPRAPETMTLSASLAMHHGARWVKTASHLGLTEADVDRAIAILSGSPPA